MLAQAKGVHPHVAPISLTAPLSFARGLDSPKFNRGDGIWNNGEGFPVGAFAPDHGGYADGDHANVQLADIHPYRPTPASGGWALAAASSLVQQFVGYLRPSSLGPYPPGGPVEDAAFEFFLPIARDPSKPLVIIIGLWPTQATGITDPATQGDQTYPGHKRSDGLYAQGDNPMDTTVFRPLDGVYLVENPPAGYQVGFAYIVPRTFDRPMTFQMQRAIQLARAVDLMITAPPGDDRLPIDFVPTDPLNQFTAKVASGGSFGGLTCQIAATRHADIFHGAVGQAFSGSLGRVPGEQAMYNYIGRGTGMHLHESSLNLRDSLEWGFYLRQVGWDYFNGSTTYRIRHQQLTRPIALQIADQDTVTNGVDWVPYFSQKRGPVAQGFKELARPGGGTVKVAWSVVDKRCHGEPSPLTTPLLGVPNSTVEDAALEMVPEAFASYILDPGGPSSIPPLVTDDGSESPYDHALARGVFVAPPPSANTFLEPDASFGQRLNPHDPGDLRKTSGRTMGQGLGMGVDESLRSYRLGGDAEDSLFVGSFDGIVTRYTRDPNTDELVVRATSVSLGVGAWALDVGVIPGIHSEPVVVVGTNRAIHVLKADDLSIITPNNTPYPLDLEHERPRRLRIAKVHATGNDRDIVFLTFHGHLMVLDDDLVTVRTDLGEPGIQDFEVHESLTYSHTVATSSRVPVTLMSHRGHLFNVTLHDQSASAGDPAELHAWTEFQIGRPQDLEVFDESGTGRRMVAGLFSCDGTRLDQIRVFDAATLQPASPAGYGKQPNGLTSLNASGLDCDFACVHDSQGTLTGFVTMTPGFVYWTPSNGAQSASSFLTSIGGFAPAYGPTALCTGEIDATEATVEQEIAISTVSGHVVWLRVSDTQAPAASDGSLDLPRPTNPGSVSQEFAHTNRTLAGSWGIVSRWVQQQQEFLLPEVWLANQAAELTRLDPTTANSSWVADMRHLSPIQFPTDWIHGEVAAPVRDLVLVGDGVQTVTNPGGATPRAMLQTVAPLPGEYWLRTQPWMNKSGRPYSPVWYQVPTPALDPLRPQLPIYHGFSPLAGGGAVTGQGLPPGSPIVRHLHWWGGRRDNYPNMVQGAYVTSGDVRDSWFSTLNTPGVYGVNDQSCKDLRNLVPYSLGSTYSVQSLRAGSDASGPLLVLGSPGGIPILMRPGMSSPIGTSADNHFGVVQWDGGDPSAGPVDDGYGAMALATRKVPGSPGQMDIFVGTCLTYPDPHAVPPAASAQMVGMIRWLRWDGRAMQDLDHRILDPGSHGDGFAVSGLAVGDIVQASGHEGAELVVATLSGHLYIFALDPVARTIGSELQHVWVEGSLGAYNSILIEDLDFAPGNELYVSGSMGVWKWKQK